MSEILYHYCSSQSFEAIISSGSFRLSALRLSNDTMEGTWLRHVFELVCSMHPTITPYRASLLEAVDRLIGRTEGLGFCLSRREDVLSQWRGYANDAKGFCIGFRRDKLLEICNLTDVTLQVIDVNYDIEKQIDIIHCQLS